MRAAFFSFLWVWEIQCAGKYERKMTTQLHTLTSMGNALEQIEENASLYAVIQWHRNGVGVAKMHSPHVMSSRVHIGTEKVNALCDHIARLFVFLFALFHVQLL